MNARAVALNTFHLAQLTEKQRQNLLDCGALKKCPNPNCQNLVFQAFRVCPYCDYEWKEKE